MLNVLRLCHDLIRMETEQDEKLYISRGELALFLVMSVMLAAAMAFSTAIVFQRGAGLSRAFASGFGLLVGLICSYPSIRILGRADGINFSFFKWFAISFGAAAFATLIIGVF